MSSIDFGYLVKTSVLFFTKSIIAIIPQYLNDIRRALALLNGVGWGGESTEANSQAKVIVSILLAINF